MYNAKHSKASPRGRSRKSLITLVALALIVVVAIGATIAWIVDSSKPVVNEFTPGKVTADIEETVENSTKTSVKVCNNGNVDAYVRVAVVINRIDGDGNVVAGSTPALSVTSDWQLLSDGYYYYKGTVAPGALTPELLASPISLDGISVDVLAQSVQVAGMTGDGTKTAVKEAWGVDYVNGSWTAE